MDIWKPMLLSSTNVPHQGLFLHQLAAVFHQHAEHVERLFRNRHGRSVFSSTRSCALRRYGPKPLLMIASSEDSTMAASYSSRSSSRCVP